MRKKVFALLLSATLATAPAVSVFAADITVTVPYYGNETGDEKVPDAKGIDVNPDGSTTYTLDTDQQEKWKESIKSDFDNNIKEILDDDTNYPNVEDITYNDDMTEFNIALSTVNLSSSEFFIGFLPLFVAPTYQQLNGVAEKDVDYTIKITDSSSGSETVQNYEENKSDWDSFMSSMNGDYTESANAETSDQKKVDKISLSSDSSSLDFSGYESMPYEGSSDTLGIVKFNFTNKTDSPSSVTSFYDIRAYQNGIELDWYMGNGNTACDNTYKTVLKDTSIEVGYGFMLKDTENPITVYVYDGYMGDSPCQMQEITIK